MNHAGSGGGARLRGLGGGFSFRAGLVALGRSLALWGLSFVAMLLSLAASVVVLLLGTGLGLVLLAPVVGAVRRLADRQRALAYRWSGVRIPACYLPAPEAASGGRGFFARLRWIVRDPQTWRDWLWLALDPVVGATLVFGPVALVLGGFWAIGLAFHGVSLSREWDGLWYLFVPVRDQTSATLAGVLGLLQLPLALWLAPRSVRLHARYTRAVLAPSGKARAAYRIERLTATRAEAADAQSAEIRRIERDLHDGAQARLVAMGMTLGAAEHLLESDPAAVRELLVQARESSSKALEELRDLVRGVHPPILADRGLGDAVRSLALICPLDVEVVVDLPGRPDAAVESAAYFAVSEVLTNAAKHSGADRVRVDIGHELGLLRVEITDDGRGGADPGRGSGLRGIERRLATFDGVLTVTSPPNGPTRVTMEIPCAVSSPKTSSSFGTE
ncbi:sensor histidine kinase [Embleya scabrispora]|uniref:sensor histidine kinase n=1 Tax=Embleya scabrispora TaxID=159449 RepID=UPI00036D1289|nr:sensor histidine kinase [Embleya scabrispora]MYS85937.1 sensor histidine kinase [Streptomyces sp. SID5474]